MKPSPQLGVVFFTFNMGICTLQLFVILSIATGVALILCQSDHVLNDGQSGKSAMEGESKRLIEKIVAEREEEDYSSD